MPFAALRGQRFFYEDTGGDRPVIVCSHGLLLDHSMFDPQLDLLREYRVIRWDERSHGRTVTSSEPYTYWDMAADLAALLRHLCLPPVTLIGFSQGGFLSLRLALGHPELVHRMVLIGSSGAPDTPQGIEEFGHLAARWEAEGVTEPLAEIFATVILGPDWVGRHAWKTRWQTLPRTWIPQPHRCLVERDDISHRLQEITVPTLVVHGEADLPIPVDHAAALQRQLGGPTQVLTVPDAPHSVSLTHPAAVNQALLTFLNSSGNAS